MKLKKLNIIVLGMLLLLINLTACGKDSQEEGYRFGSGSIGGNYYNYASNLGEMLSEVSDYKLKVMETAGSAANLRLIRQGYIDMALVQSDTLMEASVSSGNIEGIHTITGLYTESCQAIVSADSGINSIKDLKGKRVSLGAKDSGVVRNAKDILSAAGISIEDIEENYLSFAESAEALESGEIDCFFVTASAPTTAVVFLAENMDLKILPIDEDMVNILLHNNEAYTESYIEAGTYEGQAEDIRTIGVTAVLIASDGIPEELEADIVKIFTENGEELNAISFGVPADNQEEGIKNISFDMYMTLTLAVLVLYIGAFLRKRVNFLEKFCIPAPVIGGLIFAILSCVLYVTGVVEFSFDETLKSVCMIMFFTSVGFQANLKVLKSGGVSLLVFLLCVIALIFAQNGVAVVLAKTLNVSKLVGLCTGSIPMVGGHGTAGAFGIVLEDLGLEGATTLCTAAATFGLIIGSLMGGPVGRRLIVKYDLLKTIVNEDDSVLVEDEAKHKRHVSMYAPAAYQIAIAMGIGTIVSNLLSMTGMTFPVYIGAMIVAAFMRNIGEYTGKFTVHMGEINDIGGICLSLFLGIAMVTLKLWQLASLALPLFILLLVQSLLMFLFSYFVVFNIMGRNYDAAVLSAGTCGFGMGATPNAMANMQAITEKFAPSVKAYLLVPIVGSMFADFINSLVITLFINII